VRVIRPFSIPWTEDDPMKKLSLDVETLRVESFDATPVEASRGTVVAHAPSYPDPVYTCAYHCTWIGVTCD
jgi:hypothetical protein